MTQATEGVVRIVEGVHQSVWSTLGFPGSKVAGETRGLTGLVYRSIIGITRLIGKGVDSSLAALQPILESAENSEPGTPEREAVIAALNGVMGDRLLSSNNAFATTMNIRYQKSTLSAQTLISGGATGKVLLMIHGLCMHDEQWHTGGDTSNGHAQLLASTLGYTPIYLRYNSGLHISQNGRELAGKLEQLVNEWPGAIEELTVLAYSMGGLLIRSACYYAEQQNLSWRDQLKNIIFLGTPHFGAPLERVGNWIDMILGSTPYSAPFVKLSQLRSEGITDLRYSSLLDQDWQTSNDKTDDYQGLPLPIGVTCFTMAATTAVKPIHPKYKDLPGDGLVPLHSALGVHSDKRKSLGFKKTEQWVGYDMNHMGLLSRSEASKKIIQWLSR